MVAPLRAIIVEAKYRSEPAGSTTGIDILGMHAKKSLGQNFLTCRWVADTMIHASDVTKKDTVLEIGPGQGALTRPLASRAGRIIAIEKDEALARELRESLKKDGISNVEIVEGDTLKFPKEKLKSFKTFTVVANIPYYLTSRLFRYFLESAPRPKTIVFTVQKEVAERIVARPGNMNLLALSIQSFGKAEKIKNVPRECFSPKPDVESAIIRVSGISDEFFRKNKIPPERFFEIARLAFGKKRKMLSSSLKTVISPDVLERAGIHKNARPQELEIEEWARLCRAVQ